MAGTYTATQEFNAETDTELSLQIGDRVSVSEFDESRGWAYGNVGIRSGWVPCNYIAQGNNHPHEQPVAKPAPPPVAPKTPIKPSAVVENRSSVFSQNRSNLEGLFGSVPKPRAQPNNVNGQRNPQPFALRRTSDITPMTLPAPRPPSSAMDDNVRQYNGRSPANNYQYTDPVNSQRHSVAAPYINSHGTSPPPHNNGPAYGQQHGNGAPQMSPTGRFGGPPRNGTALTPTLPSTAPPRFNFPQSPGPGSSAADGSSAGFVYNEDVFFLRIAPLHLSILRGGAPPVYDTIRGPVDVCSEREARYNGEPFPNDDWWQARNKSGEMGVIPKNYVKPKQQATPVLAERLWYRHGITRDETEHQMRSKPVECYVIRDSEAYPGCFTLSVKGPDKVRHIKITTVSNGYEIGDKKFQSLDAVVDFYRNSPIYIADNGSYQLFLSRPLYR